MNGPQLPRRVRLPDAPMISAAHLRAALGVSRAVLHRWRHCYAFPASYRDGDTTWAITDDVAAWLRQYNVSVIR